MRYMNTSLVVLKKVTKRYLGTKSTSVSGLNLTINAGEVYGFLGANGAGKSTTIRMMMDFIRPTSGSIKLLGSDSREVAHRRHVGYLAGDVALPKMVTGRTLLGHLGKLGGGTDDDYFAMLTDRFEVQLDQKIGTLSKGNRQKIGLVQAFMHQPSVLILDEPTSGLDPLMQEQFYTTVREAKERGAAVFLSSHNFEEVERICDRIGIIRSGKLVYEGPISALAGARTPKWHVVVKKPADIAKLQASSVLVVSEASGTSLAVKPADTIEKALEALSRVAIVSMSDSQTELEDDFLEFYGSDEEAKL